MVTNLLHKLALATASTTLGLAVISPIPSTAATVTYDFQFDFSPLSETPITGSFSYDDFLVEDYPIINIGYCGVFPENPELGCLPGGSFVEVTDFRLNISGKTFTNREAETFNLIWNINVPFFISGPPGPTPSYYSSALEGTVSWGNPYLSLAFGSLAKVGASGSISTDITHPANVAFGEPNLFTTSYTLRNIEPTSVPEGQQELALLSLGLLGFASLLKKKLASYLHSEL
jgi:hypothetical protein